MDTIEARLESAIKKRDMVAAETRRLEGRLESAKAAKEAVEAECRAKNVDPDKIDAAIEKLETHLVKLVEDFERDTLAAEAALKPFLKEIE